MRVEISADWTATLKSYADRLQAESTAAAQKAADYLHEVVVERAQQNEEWSQLADDIQVWSEDGRLVIGIRRQEVVSQAFALEYGDEVRPPNPLFRTLNQDVRKAGEVMRGHMESKFGPGRYA